MLSDPTSTTKAMMVQTLRQTRLFAGLSESDLLQVADFVVPKRFSKGEYLFRAGEPVHGFYLILSGAINVHRVQAGGREQVIHIVRPGESFAEGALAMPRGYPADARAVMASTALLVQRNGFLGLLRRHPEMSLRMLAAMSGHLRDLVEQIEDLTIKDVETRLMHWLLKRCPKEDGYDPVKVDLQVTKRVLAAELGTVAETLSRTLARMKQKDWITVKGRSIQVQCPAALQAQFQRRLSG